MQLALATRLEPFFPVSGALARDPVAGVGQNYTCGRKLIRTMSSERAASTTEGSFVLKVVVSANGADGFLAPGSCTLLVSCFFVVVSTLLLSFDPDSGFFRHLTYRGFPDTFSFKGADLRGGQFPTTIPEGPARTGINGWYPRG